MDSLFLFLFACFVFMLRGALSSACKMGEQAVWAFTMDNRCRLARTGDTICHTDGVRLPDCWMLPASSSRPSSTNWPSRSICPSNRFPSHKKSGSVLHPQRCQDRAAFPFVPCSDFVFWLCSPMKWYSCHLCVSSNSKISKTAFSVRILWLSIKGIILRNTQLFACLVNILRILYLFLNLLLYFCKRIYLFYNNVWQRKM